MSTHPSNQGREPIPPAAPGRAHLPPPRQELPPLLAQGLPPLNARRAKRLAERKTERHVARRAVLTIMLAAMCTAVVAARPPEALAPWLAWVPDNPIVQRLGAWRDTLTDRLAGRAEGDAASNELDAAGQDGQDGTASEGTAHNGLPVPFRHPAPPDIAPSSNDPSSYQSLGHVQPPTLSVGIYPTVLAGGALLPPAGFYSTPAPGNFPTPPAGIDLTPLAVMHPAPPVIGPAHPQLPMGGTVDRPLVPGQPRQLTLDRCCSGAWWAHDSTMLEFIDRPAGSGGAAVYGVPLWPPGSLTVPVDIEVLERTQSERYVVRPEGAQSIVHDVTTGREWPLATAGDPVQISPDGTWAVWWDSPAGRAQIDALVKIQAAGVDGSNPHDLVTLWGGFVDHFLPDNQRVLVTGRPARNDALAILATLDVVTGTMVELARGLWLDNVALSPDGAWVVYTVSLDRAHPDQNGIWMVATAGGAPTKLPFVGAYRWRDRDRLVYVPMELGVPWHSIWQYDATKRQGERLMDPAAAQIRIANNDWSISPDGHSMAFMSEQDRNLWVLDLP